MSGLLEDTRRGCRCRVNWGLLENTARPCRRSFECIVGKSTQRGGEGVGGEAGGHPGRRLCCRVRWVGMGSIG